MLRNIVLRITAALAVAVAAGVVVVATSSAATANNGDALKAGQTTTETAETIVDNTSVGISCITLPHDGLLACGDTGVSGYGSVLGVFGFAPTGVEGVGTEIGVDGSSDAYGVYGDGPVSGVYGTSEVGAGIGVRGQATGLGGYGLFGDASSSTGTGIYGTATATSGTASGVEGYSSSPSGYGLFGSGQGTGVKGTTPNAAAYGVYAANTGGGLAFAASGRVSFTTAGTAVVPTGAKKIIVSLAGVSPTDFVLATVQGNTASSVKGALAGTGQFTIWLNKATTGAVTVAYFVLSAS
jgi:hypothetical protein